MHTHSELLIKLLTKRGLKTKDEIEVFLHPDYERDLLDPYLMRDMECSCVRLFEAIDNDEHVVIYADYDCDGIPGAIILEDLFKLIGFKNYQIYIPGRNNEGYGLNKDAVDQFGEDGAKLLITIDLGITAVSEVAHANMLGIDVIVTDHHLPRQSVDGSGIVSFALPHALAILNPKVDDYPEKMLCGAGVIFKFVQGFIKKYGEYFKIKSGAEKWMLDMAGLATLSDMVPLLGENRALAYFGLKVLQKSRRPGLQKLLQKMNVDQRHLTEDDVSFMLAPRLNAASRMDDPRRAYELLSTDDVAEAVKLADHLSKINDERKYIVANIMRDINKKFENRELREVLVVGNSGWRVGVLGLVAGKLCDQHQKPAFVWGKDENDAIKGSCRSPGSVSVVELMAEVQESFSAFGGHELAGGFTVNPEKVHFLEDDLSQAFLKVRKKDNDEDFQFDLKESLSAVGVKAWRDIERLAPFGEGNLKPVFLFEGVLISTARKFGKNGSGEHIELVFEDGDTKVKGVAFFSGLDSFSVQVIPDKRVNVLGTFDFSRFAGREELRLRIIDIM